MTEEPRTVSELADDLILQQISWLVANDMAEAAQALGTWWWEQTTSPIFTTDTISTGYFVLWCRQDDGAVTAEWIKEEKTDDHQ